MRRLLSLLVGLILLGALAGGAQAYERDIILGKQVLFGETATSCSFLLVFPFAEVPGAASYRAKLRYGGSRVYEPTRGPGNYYDTWDGGNGVQSAGAGTHWFNGTGGSGGKGADGCSHDDGIKNSWEVLEAKAIFPDPVIKGHVLKADGTPASGVQVKITPPTGAPYNRPVNGSDGGSYTTWGLAEQGSYGVEVVSTDGKQYCVAGAGAGCTTRTTRSVPPDAVVDWVERTPHIAGTVVQGTDGTHPNDAAPAADVPVTVSGTTTSGATLSFSTRTDQGGRYDVPARAGTWDVAFPAYACVRDVSPCTQSKRVTLNATDQEARADAVARAPRLETTVTAPDTTLEQGPDGWVAKVVPVTITVKNNGDVAATDVHLAYDDLQIGTHDTPYVPELPLQVAGKPERMQLGTLVPGASETTTIPLRLEGDGEYDLSTAAQATTGDGGSLLAPGKGTIKVAGRFVAASYAVDPTNKVGVGAARGLIAGGGVWKISVHLQNRSYQRPVVLDPLETALRGNAIDGHWQPHDQPVPDVRSLQAANGGTYVELRPRETKEMDVVVRTLRSDAFTTLAPEAQPKGGTQSRATLPDPTGNLITRDEKVGAGIAADQFLVRGDREYRVGVDDSAPKPPPFELGALAGNFSYGAYEGLYNFTAGTIGGVNGLVYDLPKAGFKYLGNNWKTYVEQTAEAWDAIRKDPALVAEFLRQSGAAVAAAYDNAPVYRAKAQEALAQVNTAVYQHYEALWKEWYAGDYTLAVRTFTAEGVEGAANIATTVGPGLLARMPKVRAALAASKQRFVARVGQGLQASGARGAVKVFDALTIMKTKVTPGFELSNNYLRSLYGWTIEESKFLRAYAKTNGLRIVVRNRAAESIGWIRKYGAVLKHEIIKIKNVDDIDAAFLGYSKKDVGRVVIPREIPTRAAVVRNLVKFNVKPGSPEYKAILQRLEQRIAEYHKDKDGLVKWIRHHAGRGKKGKAIKLNINLADNVMGVGKSEPTKYFFRLDTIKRGGKFYDVPQFRVPGETKWRCVTGDIDLLEIVDAAGRPLDDARRFRVYQDLAKSVVGFMHPESATWTQFVDGLENFNFPAKIGEFVRSVIPPAQIGPDGVVRAVYDQAASYFKSKFDYSSRWTGGYRFTGAKG